ncbi:MAG: hypothetical protein ACRDK4_05115 [Solirubrobacteraceae bacterium]
MNTLYRFGRALAGSGFFKDAKKADEAFAKLIFGRDLGLSATQAMTDIHIVEGKPEMSANLQAAKVRASGKYDYRILEHDDTKCSIEFGPNPAPMRDEQGGWLPWPQAFGVSTFTIKDAERAGLTKPSRNGAPSNHIKYPRNMNFARAMSNGVAWYCPDVMNGIRVYAEGEIGESVQVQTDPEPRTDVGDEVVEGTLADETSDPEDRPLTEEEATELGDALTAAGINDNALALLLASVGVDCTDDLSVSSAYELRQHLGEYLQRQGANK